MWGGSCWSGEAAGWARATGESIKAIVNVPTIRVFMTRPSATASRSMTRL